MKIFLFSLLQCTLSMSLITLLYVAITPILSKRYDAKWRYIIWIVIAIGWLIPIRPSFSLPILPANSTNTPILPLQYTPNPPVIQNTIHVSTTQAEALVKVPQLSIFNICFIIWIIGVIIMLTFHITRHIHFNRMVNRWSETVTNPDILHLLTTLQEEQGIKSKITCKTCSIISSPMLVGLYRPIILMPTIPLSQHELTLILRHELIHLKRHDLWYKVIVLAATILHWFNPFVYLMAKASSLQCEISCDAKVLQNEDLNTRRLYGETIISVVRRNRIPQTAFSTNFYGGKREMKSRIISILDGKRKKTAILLCCIVLIGIVLTGATLVSAKHKDTFIPNTAFTKEEYQKLLSLQFDNYQDMSVATFQQKVWDTTDSLEYMQLLDNFYQDKQLDSMKDTNDIASFLFYELVPLTAENWKSRYFKNGCITDIENAGQSQFEYTCTLTIKDANNLTVKEYNQTRKNVMEELMHFFQGQTDATLQNEGKMLEAIEAKINSLIKRYSNNFLTVQIDYFFIPLEIYELPEDMEQNNADNSNDEIVEEREYPHGTKEDYSSLLKLKTADYKNRTLEDFNADVLDWANTMDYDVFQGILTDIGFDDFAVTLTDEELSFLKLTFSLSNRENAAMIDSERTGVPTDPSFGGTPFIIDEYTDNGNLYARLYYQMSYHIPDKTKVTVGERDRCVGGVISAIQNFWDNSSIDELVVMNKDDVRDKLQGFAKQYSNELITINFEPTTQWFNFENIDGQYSQEPYSQDYFNE